VMVLVECRFCKQIKKSTSIIGPADQRPVFRAGVSSDNVARKKKVICYYGHKSIIR
jgi:hypothetical protein